MEARLLLRAIAHRLDGVARAHLLADAVGGGGAEAGAGVGAAVVLVRHLLFAGDQDLLPEGGEEDLEVDLGVAQEADRLRVVGYVRFVFVSFLSSVRYTSVESA